MPLPSRWDPVWDSPWFPGFLSWPLQTLFLGLYGHPDNTQRFEIQLMKHPKPTYWQYSLFQSWLSCWRSRVKICRLPHSSCHGREVRLFWNSVSKNRCSQWCFICLWGGQVLLFCQVWKGLYKLEFWSFGSFRWLKCMKSTAFQVVFCLVSTIHPLRTEIYWFWCFSWERSFNP